MNRIPLVLVLLVALAGCEELFGDGGGACYGSEEYCLSALTAADGKDAGGDINVKPDLPDVEDDSDGATDMPDDGTDGTDIPDVPDVEDTEDTEDSVDTEDIPDEGDTPDAEDVPDTTDLGDGSDAEDVPDTDDAEDSTDTPDAPETDDGEVIVVDPCEGKICDDENPCTVDTCINGECSYMQAGEDEPCDDGNPCTENDTCDLEGKCQPGEMVQCDDGDPCTFDSCDPETEDGCVYGEPIDCVDDLCAPAECMGNGQCGEKVPVVCETDQFCKTSACNPETGECVEETLSSGKQGLLCDDEDVCTVDSCNLEMGICHNEVVSECKCNGVTCNDANPCTLDTCNPFDGECVFENTLDPCEDGDECTVEDRCEDGACVPGSVKDCTDDDPCTAETCNSDSGECESSPLSGVSCDDGSPCTQQDVCESGNCLGTNPVICDDTNSCTDDSCDPVSGECQFINNVQSCDDGNLCTTGDLCQAGECKGKAVPCGDDSDCTDDSCNPDDGLCQFIFNTASCDDGDLCTSNDGCANGECSGTPITCDDANPCTLDSCDQESGECMFVPTEGACCMKDEECDDSNPCTTGTCSDEYLCQQEVLTEWCFIDGECVVGGSTDPSNECRACVTDQGNQKAWTLLGGDPCDDDNPCTENDTCSEEGECGGAEVLCDDGDVCTDDFCDSADGECKTSNNTAPCDDLDGCTVGDTCQDGACVVSQPKSCDDENPCTIDSCQEGGCQYVAVVCDDGSECTVDACDEVEECVTTPVTSVDYELDVSLPSEIALPPSWEHCPDNVTGNPGICVDYTGTVGTETTAVVDVAHYGMFCIRAKTYHNFNSGEFGLVKLEQVGSNFTAVEGSPSAVSLPTSEQKLCLHVKPGQVTISVTEGDYTPDGFFGFDVLLRTISLNVDHKDDDSTDEADTCLKLEAEDAAD